MTRELLKQKSKEEIFDFIRERLKFGGDIESQLSYVDKEVFKKEHRRFEMSGGEENAEHNLAIVNEFADLGIYDYTNYLFVDFYKGSVVLRMQYINNNEELVFNLSSLGTRAIIYEIFEKTILSDAPIKPPI